ncbi:MAG: lysine--tRNA ligase [Promethearchaeota archaeon]
MSRSREINFEDPKIEKMQKLIEKGILVYPYKFDRTSTISDVKEKYKDVGHDKTEDVVRVAGRIHNIRYHGRAMFVDIKDQDGIIQIYLRENVLGKEKFRLFKEFFDRGDIIGVVGPVFRTKMGEITIWAEDFELLSKALIQLPEKFHGLKNVEKRYRMRYLDLIVNDDVKKTFLIRSRLVTLLREYLSKRGFLEFETPVLQPIYGGANARPFKTYHNFLQREFYLRIAPELYLKRLVVGGFEKVFEIAKNFRNEDIDVLHNPEFTMVEIYEAYKDYNDMMDLCEELISWLAEHIHQSLKIEFDGKKIDLTRPWRRMTMADAVKEFAGIDVFEHTVNDIKALAKEKNLQGYETARSTRELLVVLFEGLVEKSLTQPTFILDFPVEVSPLAKKHRNQDGFTERFELFINGWEIANGFSELNDPVDQKIRFEDQETKRKLGDLEAQMIDYDYINALAYGMPPTGGIGIGIDRLTMLFTDKISIKEVILFPQMKTSDDDKKIVENDHEK